MPKPEQEIRTQDTVDAKAGKHEHPAANLYADADLSKRQDGGAEANFVRTQAQDMRKELHLKPDATSQQLYDALADNFVKMFPKYPNLQAEALHDLHLKQDQVGNHDTVRNAIIARDRRETGTPDGASLTDLEKNVHKRTYKMMKDGTLPIDYD